MASERSLRLCKKSGSIGQVKGYKKGARAITIKATEKKCLKNKRLGYKKGAGSIEPVKGYKKSAGAAGVKAIEKKRPENVRCSYVKGAEPSNRLIYTKGARAAADKG
ncbi:hypothetical protein [Bacillus altitudinis]|uniref:hypothetical protein n=1 Tax=Bacillus altitudinis TaxID=293387 RepID=UPI0039BFA02C